MEAKDVNDNHEGHLESLSAMMDDELSFVEKNNIMTQIKASPVLQEKWRHYYVIKAILRKRALVELSTDEIASQVMLHAASENPLLANQHNPD